MENCINIVRYRLAQKKISIFKNGILHEAFGGIYKELNQKKIGMSHPLK